MDFTLSHMGPSPQTTLGILLGASIWPFSSLQDSQAFARSANRVRNYFFNQFGLPPANWLDLFDTNQKSPNEVDQAIGNFLDKRISQMKQIGAPARDLLFYYIGHGIFAPGSDQAYHLAIRCTRDESLRTSAVAMVALAETLKTKARHLRRIMILDCCFSAESFKYMQSTPDQVAIRQTFFAFEEKSIGKGFPHKGTALLCSSGHKVPSLILPDESGTMFTEALMRALALGNARQSDKTHLSLYELKASTEEILEGLSERSAPRPFVGSPDQSDGDVAFIPFFPNSPAYNKFTEEARRVLSFAQEEARSLQHNYIGTEHLLLGLVRARESGAAKILANLGVDLNKVHECTEYVIGHGDQIVLDEIGLTPRSKKVIALAIDEAIYLNHHHIGTEHLLLGLVREGEGIGAGILKEGFGVNLEKARTQIIQILKSTEIAQPICKYVDTN